MLKEKNRAKISMLALILSVGIFSTGCEKVNGLFSGSDANDESSDIMNKRYTSTPMSFLKFRDIPMAGGTVMDIGRSSIYGDPYNWTGDLFLTAPYTFDGMFDFYNTEMKRFAWMPLGVVKGKNTIMTFLRHRRVATIQVTRDDEKGSQIIVTMVTAPRNMEDYYQQYRIGEIKRGRWILQRGDIRMMEEKGMQVTNEMRALANENAGKGGFSTIEVEDQRRRQIEVMRGLKEIPLSAENVPGASSIHETQDEKENVLETLKQIQETAENKAEGLQTTIVPPPTSELSEAYPTMTAPGNPADSIFMDSTGTEMPMAPTAPVEQPAGAPTNIIPVPQTTPATPIVPSSADAPIPAVPPTTPVAQ